MQLARVIGDVVVDAQGRQPRRHQAAGPAAADAGRASRPAARWSRSTRSAPASAKNVFFVRGKEASFPFYPAEPPVDAGIVGIVDHWDRRMRMQIERSQTGCRLPASSAPSSSTQKHRKFEGAKLLLVQPLNARRHAARRRAAGGRRRRRRRRREGAGRARRTRGRRGARQEGGAGRRRDHRHHRHGSTIDGMTERGTARAGPRRRSRGTPARPAPTAAPASADPCPRCTPSHGRLPLVRGGDDDGACVIEPAVRCNHCGYCQSLRTLSGHGSAAARPVRSSR